VDDECGSALMEERVGALPKRGAGDHEAEFARALGIDGKVGQIAYMRMRSLGIVDSVMGAGGVEVPPCGSEGGTLTLSDIVNVNAVLTGSELRDVDRDLHTLSRSGKGGVPDGGSLGVGDVRVSGFGGLRMGDGTGKQKASGEKGKQSGGCTAEVLHGCSTLHHTSRDSSRLLDGRFLTKEDWNKRGIDGMKNRDPCPLRYAESIMLPTMDRIHEAQRVLSRYMSPTPQYTWPLLNRRLGTEAWIKHENHTAVGAFKMRGALVYLQWMRESQPELRGVIAATRGNHGQGVAMAARLMGMPAVIVVPFGNSKEKNRAIAAQGAELVEHGQDFQESLEFARGMAVERGLAMVDSFHERLVMGTATYALELFTAAPPLARVYVPIGLGSSICGVCAARNALGLKTEVVGVVAAESPSYALSFAQRKVVEAPAQTRIADGLACRRPNEKAMEAIWGNVARIVEVSDDQIEEAMRIYYTDTHNLAEGAGAAALAGALLEPQTPEELVGIVLTGGNVDSDAYRDVLAAGSNTAEADKGNG